MFVVIRNALRTSKWHIWDREIAQVWQSLYASLLPVSNTVNFVKSYRVLCKYLTYHCLIDCPGKNFLKKQETVDIDCLWLGGLVFLFFSRQLSFLTLHAQVIMLKCGHLLFWWSVFQFGRRSAKSWGYICFFCLESLIAVWIVTSGPWVHSKAQIVADFGIVGLQMVQSRKWAWHGHGPLSSVFPSVCLPGTLCGSFAIWTFSTVKSTVDGNDYVDVLMKQMAASSCVFSGIELLKMLLSVVTFAMQ